MKKTILMILALGIYLIFIPDYSNFALELKAFAALAIIQMPRLSFGSQFDHSDAYFIFSLFQL